MNFLLLALLSLLSCNHVANAFWSNGHMIVAAVAKETLLEQKNNATLIKALHYVSELAEEYPNAASFIGSGPWMDSIKRYTRQYSNWHFNNRVILGDDAVCHDESPTDILWALPRSVEYLKNGNYIDSLNKHLNASTHSHHTIDATDPAVAIRFIIHLVGDIHQPLHASTYCLKKFAPKGDYGGNDYFVYYNRTRLCLHKVYDGMGFQYPEDHVHYDPQHDEPESEQERMALKYARNLMKIYPVSSFKEYDEKDAQGYDKWADESYEIASNFAYSVDQYTDLDEKYIERVRYLMNRRVVLAGYRLANLLNYALN